VNIWVATGWLLILITWWSGSPAFLTRADTTVLTATGEICGTHDIWQIHSSVNTSQATGSATSGITLVSDGRKSFATLKFKDCIGSSGQLYRVSALVERLTSVSWASIKAKQTLFFIRSRLVNDQAQYDAVHRWGGFWPSSDIDQLFRLKPGSKDPSVHFMVRSAGSWRISQVSVKPIVMQPWAGYVLPMLIVLWLGWLVLGVRRLVLRKGLDFGNSVVRWPVFLVAGCVVTMVMGALVSPGQWLYFTEPVFTLLGVNTESLRLVSSLNDIGHVVGFLLLTVIVVGFTQLSRCHLVLSISFCIMMALAIEALQRHKIGRAPQLYDLWLDGLGIATGLVIVLIVSVGCRVISALRARRVSSLSDK